MNTKRLCLAVLLAGAAFAAHAGDKPALEGCVELGAQQEIVRNGGSQAFLLRDGDSHYRVALQGSCDSLAIASSISIIGEGAEGRLCPSGSQIKTNRGKCEVGKVELLDADEFATLKRRARR
ncbi:hypothetical protein CSC62_13535 [Pseudoxanthomonas jiangsuensis]|uniref:hypothetical protein n=1 Tax=Pseudoxanthomonas jiangsuensis TaxID=619688 RepID=UPI001390D959|nr:hypothetical protein [Pseudoxanthomonas jiangsuensis]KAF1693189.1 hypothetical protein CSC62_13535 [Pseudoxanthomonas jiangsuensis]